jgi:hypothetical protein
VLAGRDPQGQVAGPFHRPDVHRFAVHAGPPAGPVENGEGDAASFARHPPDLAGGGGLHLLRLQARAVQRNRPGRRVRLYGRVGREGARDDGPIEVLVPDGRPDVAGEQFVEEQPLPRHVLRADGEPVGVEGDQHGGRQDEAAEGLTPPLPPAEGAGGGVRYHPQRGGREEGLYGEKAPGELHHRQQRQVVPEGFAERGDHQGGDDQSQQQGRGRRKACPYRLPPDRSSNPCGYQPDQQYQSPSAAPTAWGSPMRRESVPGKRGNSQKRSSSAPDSARGSGWCSGNTLGDGPQLGQGTFSQGGGARTRRRGAVPGPERSGLPASASLDGAGSTRTAGRRG